MQTIRDRIKRELDRGNTLNVREVADAVMVALPTDDHEAALRVALPSLVRDVIVTTRTTSPSASSNRTASVTPSSRSWKVEAVRESWRKELRAIYSTPTGNKRLGDFSYSDLTNLAETCRDLAKANAGRADKYESLAEAMRSAGVASLSELPASVLASEFGGAR